MALLETDPSLTTMSYTLTVSGWEAVDLRVLPSVGSLTGAGRDLLWACATEAHVTSWRVGGRWQCASLVVSVVASAGDHPAEAAAEVAGIRLASEVAGLTALAEDGITSARLSGVHLPAGRALRIVRRRVIGYDDTAGLAVTEVQYVVPRPGTADVAILTFSTAETHGDDSLLDEFEAIAHELSWR